jgi:hypothetical protein
MMLVVMHPNAEGYKCHTVPFMEYEAKYIIDNALEKKKANAETATNKVIEMNKHAETLFKEDSTMPVSAGSRLSSNVVKRVTTKQRRGIEMPSSGWTSAC